MRGITCLRFVQDLPVCLGCSFEESLSEIPGDFARLLSPRPLEGSSRGRGRLLWTERSLAESVRDLEVTVSFSVYRIQRVVFSPANVLPTSSFKERMSSTKPGYRLVSSSMAWPGRNEEWYIPTTASKGTYGCEWPLRNGFVLRKLRFLRLSFDIRRSR